MSSITVVGGLGFSVTTGASPGPRGPAGPDTLTNTTTSTITTTSTSPSYLVGVEGGFTRQVVATSVGLSVLTATTQADARTAIGAGTPYTLPAATTTVRGGVRPGDNLVLGTGSNSDRMSVVFGDGSVPYSAIARPPETNPGDTLLYIDEFNGWQAGPLADNVTDIDGSQYPEGYFVIVGSDGTCIGTETFGPGLVLFGGLLSVSAALSPFPLDVEATDLGSAISLVNGIRQLLLNAGYATN